MSIEDAEREGGSLTVNMPKGRLFMKVHVISRPRMPTRDYNFNWAILISLLIILKV